MCGAARVGTEVDEKHGEGGVGGVGVQQNSRALCPYTRHWETHSNTFTHSHTETVVHRSACFSPPPHRLTLASRRAAPSPVQSWVLELITPLCCSPPTLREKRETDRQRESLPCSLAFLLTELNSQDFHSQLQAFTADLKKNLRSSRQTVNWWIIFRGSSENPANSVSGYLSSSNPS